MKAKIYITLKPEFLDSKGNSKKEDLARNGYNEVEDVTQSKYIELELRSSKSRRGLEKRVDEMCKKLLANPTYETYRFEIDN